VVPELALGLGHVCAERYIVAFPYVEPDRRGNMTFTVIALERDPDGTVHEGEHKKIYHLGDEGLYIDRWHQIKLIDRSIGNLIRFEYLLEDPDGTAWYVGASAGVCPGDEIAMIGFFPVENPDDYVLLMTQDKPEAPVDFWLQDGERLMRYNWKPWTATLLWSHGDVPGRLMDVQWGDQLPDQSGAGVPDLVLHWDVDGKTVPWGYSADGTGFVEIGPLQSD
jgi:hypothetical protein